MTPPGPGFRRLGWKLTFSYTFVTVTAVLVFEAIALLALMFLIRRPATLQMLAEQIAIDTAQEAAPFLVEDQDTERLPGLLAGAVAPGQSSASPLQVEVWTSQETLSGSPSATAATGSDLLVVVDAAGGFLSSNDLSGEAAPGGRYQDPQYPGQSLELIGQALEGKTASRVAPDQGVLAATPVLLQDGKVAGAVYLRLLSFFPDFTRTFWVDLAKLLGLSAVIFTIGAGAAGTLFGFFTARGLTRRLASISTAADSWSQGSFAAYIQDHSGDELSLLSQRLNRMAEQLQNLLHARQELAAIEERNRLARDLHDSVKQQVFAAGMQIGAARTLLARDLQAAYDRLNEAEQLNRSAQDELSAIIHELRPAALQGRGLGQALQDYCAGWSRSHDIPVELRLRGTRSLPLEHEQALFRIVQEALSNASRHSHASRIEIQVQWESNQLEMFIQDNGQGFEVELLGVHGLGLQTMRERVEALGGIFQVESAPGEGCTLHIRLPIPPAL